MSSFIYNAAKADLLKGDLDLEANTIKAMLVDAGYTPDPDHDFVDEGGSDDPVDHELSGTGYTGGLGGSGRKTLASKTVTESDANNKAVFDAADLTWSSINAGTVRWILLVKEGGSDAASRLIACLDPGSSYVTNGTDLTVTFNAGGILELA